MDKKFTKFFWFSTVGAISVCIAVFAWLMILISSQTNDTILKICNIYMTEMNTESQQKFSVIVSMRLSQVRAMIARTPPGSSMDREKLMEELSISADVRDFYSAALLSVDGKIETVYGTPIELIDNYHNIMDSLENDGNVVAQGQSGEDRLFVVGCRAVYEMSDGDKSVALIVAIPMESLQQDLFVESESSLLYSHIVDSNGNYIIRHGNAFSKSFFDKVLTEYDTFEGKTPDMYVEELQSAISKGEDYFTIYSENGERVYLYCSALEENRGWYLISVMPGNLLSQAINDLSNDRVIFMFIGVGVVLVAMSVVFLLYYRWSRRQMRELVETRQEAIHANHAKSEFLSSMSHDIRTPMNAIIGMTEIALKNIYDCVRVEDCLKKVKLSSKHLLGLINDVLDMSKIESGKMTLNNSDVSLRDAMDNIVNIMQPQLKAKNQYFDIFIQNILSENIECDGVRLSQILLNLLSNAVKYTPEGGRIDVHMYQELSPNGDDYVRTHFRVTDTGIGMSEEFQKRIFDTFSREETDLVTHITGAGLGMAITKSIVDLMGGTILLSSEQGKGSDFHIVLDLKISKVKLDDMQLPPWNVLVLDDNELLCISAVANLEELGVHAEWTRDGMEAVRMIEEHHRNKEDYRFVLIDWKMPNMDGMATIHEIHNRVGRKVPIFLISAYDWGDVEEEAYKAEIEGFISKPLFKSTLYHRLSPYMESYDEKKIQNEENEVDFNGKHILLSEDIDINWEVAQEILSSTGLILDRAENGQECVDMFKASEVGFYDAILMDIRMPVMNGYDATKIIRQLDREDSELPIIAMTADAFSDDAQHCLEVGMNAHIPKPIDVKECLRILQQFLEV